MKGSLAFIERNRILLEADELHDDGVGELFRNMHTIKGNARTYQFNFLNDILHESETSYKKFRDGDEDSPSQAQLLEELDGVAQALSEYQEVYEGKLKGAAAQSTGIPESLVDAFGRLSSALSDDGGLVSMPRVLSTISRRPSRGNLSMRSLRIRYRAQSSLRMSWVKNHRYSK